MVTKSTYTSLLGYDPREEELARRKLWAGAYASASSPWEKIGLGLSQLGGALFDKVAGDDKADPVSEINKIATEAGQQFTPNSPDYFRYISENASNPIVKQNAAQLYRESLKAETKQNREDIEFVQKNPDQLPAELESLTARLEAKARTLGWNPQDPLQQEVPADIQAKLQTTPEYRKILQLSTAGQTGLVEREQAREKKETDLALSKMNLSMKDLDIRAKELNIDKLSREISGIKNDVLASREFFRVNNLDYTKPLDAQNIPAKLKYTPGFMSSLISAQKKALEGTPASPAAPAEPTVKPLTKAEVESQGGKFDPAYDYAIVNGELRRKKKQ